ncbi:MAG TPA: hemerythrin domain-containing protein [Natronosporangium sp.]
MRDQTKPGWALQRLLDIHALIRNDLASLRQAVAAVAANGAGDQAAAALANLSIGQPDWSLHRYCAEFCSFIHEHHSVEDAVMFPSVLDVAGDQPGLRATVDRLRAEHAEIATYVDAAGRAVAALPGDAGTRATAISALTALADRLAGHLAYEEESLAAALNEVSNRLTPEDVGAPEPPVRR